jgi:hypothetical protein
VFCDWGIVANANDSRQGKVEFATGEEKVEIAIEGERSYLLWEGMKFFHCLLAEGDGGGK